MSTTVQVADRTLSGTLIREIDLEFDLDRVSVMDLLKTRVLREVVAYNNLPVGVYQGLVRPSESEEVVGGYRLKEVKTIDWEDQFNRVVEAFERTQILVLINDRQAESLDEIFFLSDVQDIVFIKLVSLVGG